LFFIGAGFFSLKSRNNSSGLHHQCIEIKITERNILFGLQQLLFFSMLLLYGDLINPISVVYSVLFL